MKTKDFGLKGNKKNTNIPPDILDWFQVNNTYFIFLSLLYLLLQIHLIIGYISLYTLEQCKQLLQETEYD